MDSTRKLTYELTTKDSASEGFKKAADEATASQRRVEDSTGRLRVAELKLEEVRKSGTATASQLAAAEEGVARAGRSSEAANQKLSDSLGKVESASARVKRADEEFVRSVRDAETAAHATAAEMDSMGKSAAGIVPPTINAGKSLKGMGDNASSGGLPALSPMMVAIAAGATLVGPAAGAAAAGVLGAGAAAGTAYLAFQGLKNEMSQNTVIGKQLKGELGGLTSELTTLERVAAANVAPGVIGALDNFRKFLPELNPLVGAFAGHLGNATKFLSEGLVSGLRTAEPLMSDFGGYIERGAKSLASFAESPQFKQFIDYARAELPIVGRDLLDIGKAGVDLAVALQPAGDALLRIVDNAAKAVDLVAKAVKTVTTPPPPPKDNASFREKTNSDFWSILLTGADTKVTESKKKVAAASATVTTALTAEALSTQSLAAMNGMAVDTYTAASGAIAKTADALKVTTAQMYLESDAGGMLKQSLDLLSGKQLNYAAAQNSFDQQIVSTTNAMGKHNQALIDAQVAQEKSQDSLNKLQSSGKATADQLTAAQAALAKANHNLAVAEDKSGTSLVGMSDSAVKNRGDLIRLVQSAENTAEAFGSMDKTGGRTRDKLIQLRQEIINNAVANGENRQAVTRLIDSILKIPPRAVTKIDANASQAAETIRETKRALAGIPNRSVAINGEAHGLDAVNAAINWAARDRLAVINVQQNIGEAHGLAGHAGGAFSFAGGRTRLEEAGGEVVDLPKGSRIYPKGQTPPSQGGGATINVTVNVTQPLGTPNQIAAAVAPALATAVRNGMPKPW